MRSTKKRKKTNCNKCDSFLTAINWNKYDRNHGYYICKKCRKLADSKYHKSDFEYSKKQNARYRMKRSAVILAYGNVCSRCTEDDYTKLTINGSINYLYDNIMKEDGYQVLCYNCKHGKPYKNKYAMKYKIELINSLGGCCHRCHEELATRLTVFNNQLLCYNCKYSQIAEEELISSMALEH